MPNQGSPTSPRFTGLFRDQANGKIELYYLGTLVTSWDASTTTIPSSQTETNSGTVNFDGAVDFDSTLNAQGATISPNVKRSAYNLGSTAAVASNGAGAILRDSMFVAPADLKIVAAYRINQTASDVTVGTSISSASYRRVILICNTAGTGSGTDIVASLNATASAASLGSRSFTTVASTVPAGSIIAISHLTVGAETADGTDMAASVFLMHYEYV